MSKGKPRPAYGLRPSGGGMGGGGAMAADMSVPINPGSLQLTATVTLTYEIK